MNRDFKGIWIPKEIWLRDDLSALDKVILAEISSLDNENHCTASNEYFAKFCQCSESKVTKAIKKLFDLKLIEQISFDGRHRTLAVKNTRQDSKKYEAGPEKVRSNNISSNTNSKLFISKEINSRQNSAEIEAFLDSYHQICISYPKVSKLTDKRRKAISNIIKKYSRDDIIQVFKNLENSDFCKGKNDRSWKADIDFILREDKFVNVLEGKYNSSSKSKKLDIFGESDKVATTKYSDNELELLKRQNIERARNGQRTQF